MRTAVCDVAVSVLALLKRETSRLFNHALWCSNGQVIVVVVEISCFDG